MTSTKTPSRRLLREMQDQFRARRAARANRRDLERQLASYRTPREINDLLLLIGRQDSPGAEEVREILEGNLADWARRAA